MRPRPESAYQGFLSFRPSVTSQTQKTLACLFWHVVTSLTSTMFWHLVTSLKSTTLIVAWRRARRCSILVVICCYWLFVLVSSVLLLALATATAVAPRGHSYWMQAPLLHQLCRLISLRTLQLAGIVRFGTLSNRRSNWWKNDSRSRTNCNIFQEWVGHDGRCDL